MSVLNIRQNHNWTYRVTKVTNETVIPMSPAVKPGPILSLTKAIRRTTVSTDNYFLLCVFALVFIALFATGGGPLGRKFSSVLWGNPHCPSLLVVQT